jgi:hypothetical protein
LVVEGGELRVRVERVGDEPGFEDLDFLVDARIDTKCGQLPPPLGLAERNVP